MKDEQKAAKLLEELEAIYRTNPPWRGFPDKVKRESAIRTELGAIYSAAERRNG